jgi:Phosphatidylethanolamine-binding protein
VRRHSPLGHLAFLAPVFLTLCLVLVVLLTACSTSGRELRTPGPTRPPSAVISAGTMDFTLSDATATGELAESHGAAFGGVAPPVSWGRVPDKAKFLILVADIPKADFGTEDQSVLWLVPNINPSSEGIVEGQNPDGDVYIAWSGPTIGRGEQVKVRFRLYAVTKPLDDSTESPLEIVVRLDKQNVGKSEFVVPFAPKVTS